MFPFTGVALWPAKMAQRVSLLVFCFRSVFRDGFRHLPAVNACTSARAQVEMVGNPMVSNPVPKVSFADSVGIVATAQQPGRPDGFRCSLGVDAARELLDFSELLLPSRDLPDLDGAPRREN